MNDELKTKFIVHRSSFITNFAAWSNLREISGRNLNQIAAALGMEKHEVLRGLELRKADTALARTVQQKLATLIAARNSAA
jgi:hypothetical protein